MTPWVATRRDLLRRLPASALVPDARQLAGYVVASNALDMPGHEFLGGELVTFAARTGAELDSAIDPVTAYAVAPINGRFFRLVGVTLAGDGVGLPWVLEDFGPRIDEIMAEMTSYLIANAKAYKAPWYTPPLWAPGIVADLAAPVVVRLLRVAPARYDVDDVKAAAEAAEKFVEHLRKGEPMTDGAGPLDSSEGKPDNAARAGCGRTSAGWSTGVL